LIWLKFLHRTPSSVSTSASLASLLQLKEAFLSGVGDYTGRWVVVVPFAQEMVVPDWFVRSEMRLVLQRGYLLGWRY